MTAVVRDGAPLAMRIAVLTISDTRDLETDRSGDTLAGRLQAAGHELADRSIVPDDIAAIRARVEGWATSGAIDVILTTGGTGFAPRDVTPEAIRPLLRREMEGFSILFHQVSFNKIGLSTLQSRAFAGQIGDCFVFCLPGSPGACRDGWDEILTHVLDSRYLPCSLAGSIPRLAGRLDG